MANNLDINKMLSQKGKFYVKSQKELTIHLICDPLCSDSFIDQALALFTSFNSNAVSLEVDVIDGQMPNIKLDASICIILGQNSKYLGDIAHMYNKLNIPCAVLFSTNNTAFVSKTVYEDVNQGDTEFHYGIHTANIIYLQKNNANQYNFGPMSKWLVNNARTLSVIFAKNFDILKKSISNELVMSYAIDNLSFSLTNFLPYKSTFNDLTYNQSSMVLDLAIIYGQDIDDTRRKELMAVLGVAVGSKTLAKKIVSRLSWGMYAVKGIIPFAVTYYLGKLAIGYFEKGASITDLLEQLK